MDHLAVIQSKICDKEEALRVINGWRLRGDKIVFTNGCFDILHTGHVTYLAKTADEGNRLVLGLNTDASVKRQGKGEERPINKQDSRAIVMASLHVVDLVVFFDGDTPLDLIKHLQPDVLAKGADYAPSCMDETDKRYIVGSKEVKAYGGKVVAIPFVDGFSTTNLINTLKG